MENNFLIPQTAILKNAVHLFWQIDRSNTDNLNETIIPKGIIEIIFSFYEPSAVTAQLGDQTYLLPRCFINGYNTKPFYLHLPVRQTLFGVQLHPTTVKKIFSIPAGELANDCVDMELIDTSINSLWHRLAEQKSFGERVAVFSNWLEKRIFNLTVQEKGFDNFLNDHTYKTPSASELSKILCYSPRHLSRKMQELTGLNTEETLLYKKYLQSVHLIHHSKLSLTEIAYTCGFADQSHFTKTFKSFSHILPKEYKNIRSHILGHVYKNVR